MIHYFLVDLYNSGELFSVGCIGNKDEIQQYFYDHCQEVIFIESKDKPKKTKRRTKMGKQEHPWGRIISCHYVCDRYQSLPRSRRIYGLDERYHTW